MPCMTSNPPELTSAGANGLAAAIAKNEEAADAVQEVADELCVVHAVLTHEAAEVAQDGDAVDALERTAALEKKLSDTAEKMHEVNQALAEQHASLQHLIKAK